MQEFSFIQFMSPAEKGSTSKLQPLMAEYLRN